MALGRGDEADRAVTVLVVVPLDQRGGPSPGGCDIGERVNWVRRTIFERFEQGFRVRIVVADGGTSQRSHAPQFLQRRQHRGALHRAAVVGVQGGCLIFCV